MKNLLLTLGHNSSAILVENDRIVWGYETERITGIKSDSQFPAPVMQYAAQNFGFKLREVDCVYVTHWAPSGKLSDMSAKHWNPSMFDGLPIRTLSPDLSHHDTHMHAARCYAGDAFPYPQGTYGLVIDGFGMHGEHLSVYDLHGGEPKLVRRMRGYDTSLGLWYQYATAFLGMRMHEDEYKILGYEAHIDPIKARLLDIEACHKADLWIEHMGRLSYLEKDDPLYNLDALAHTKNSIFSHLNDVAGRNGVTDPTSRDGRIVMGYYVQAVLEAVVLRIVAGLKPKHVICSGGVFHNVKLNHLINQHVDGKVCVMPLCGDQGNALGLYYHDHPGFTWPKDLLWGKRKLKDVGVVINLWVVDDEAKAQRLMSSFLNDIGYVNIVRGNMEFGPRSLCNTSTIALPTLENVAMINAANDRNTVMPMAPCVTPTQYFALFENTEKVWKSHQHMIMAMEYREHPEDELLGIAHRYSYPDNYQTGRPQVVQNWDWLMTALLNQFGPLINTSFNFHGKPIALDMESVIANHMEQYRRDRSFHTVVISNA
jgi:carbamoyltransferase